MVLALQQRPERLREYRRRNGAFGRVHFGKVGALSWDGCLAGHRAIWTQAERDTLVFEDDVVLTPDWVMCLQAVKPPADWDLLYLGGQHVDREGESSAGLARCQATVRTHAYVVRHSSIARLLELTEGVSEHLDTALSARMRLGQVVAYAMCPWVAGQVAGLSSITGRQEPERWWTETCRRTGD